jgi:small-conductance mechanosensitive channel
MSTTPVNVAPYLESEKWIARLTLILGGLAAVPVALFYGPLWGAGILVGTSLAWFNFRWLKQGLDALTVASTAQADQPKPQVPITTYFKALLRYGLMGIAVYVIFKYLNVPILSMIFGLCALGAATLAVSVYEILHPQE